jgi:excisionase family DNA binding protein
VIDYYSLAMMTVAEAARALGVSESTLRYWITTGKLRHRKRDGRIRLFERDVEGLDASRGQEEYRRRLRSR